MGINIAVIPDSQVRPGVNTDYLLWIASYIVDKKPDVIVHLGDFADLPSLSSHDKAGSKSMEGKRYKEDIESVHIAMEKFLQPIRAEQNRQKKNKEKMWKPRMVMLYGNHCLSDDHEILTKRGWVGLDTISESDFVLTLDGWQPIQRIICRHLQDGEKMYSYDAQGASMFVTEKHRIIYTSNNNGKVLEKPAEEIGKSFDIITSVKSNNTEFHLTDCALSLAAWACTDSHYTKSGQVIFYQRESNYKKITDLLDSLGFEYSLRFRDRDIRVICGKVLKKRPEVNVEIQLNKEESKRLKYSLGVSSNKHLPDWYHDLSDRQWGIFLETLIEADGSKFKDGRPSTVFYGKENICNDVQAGCVSHNMRASITEYRPGHFRVNIHPSTKVRVDDFKEDTSGYDGLVWCITTEAGNFMTRRNGRAHITGNCNRINRAIENDPKLDGLIGLEDLKYKEYGWETVDFLKPIVIEGVAFCHYMTSGVMGRPVTSARMLLTKHHQSCVVGHQQGRDIAYGHRADGKEMTALIAGSCYLHDESYLNYQTNNHWRGIYFLHDVNDGSFDEMALSLTYLQKRYAN